MTKLQDTIKNIHPIDPAAIKAIHAQLSKKMSNAAGLGCLRDILVRYAGITKSNAIAKPKKYTVICCADHGVAEMKVSAYPPETTLQMTANYLISRGAAANALANFAESELFVVDLGIATNTEHLPGLIQRKIAFGTKNSAKGPAMTRAQAIKSIETGIEIADTCCAQGCCCFLPGEMGIANTTSSAAIAAAFCGLTPEEATGRGTNISDARLKIKIEVVRQALSVNAPDSEDGLDVLMKVGGFELGCIAGIILGAAAHHAFVILDGFNTGAAALIAQSLCPDITDFLFCSHIAAEPAHKAVLEKLRLTPYMDLKLRLGEAIGSSITGNLLDAAVGAYESLTVPEEEQLAESALFFHEVMPPAAPPLSDKTFDFYLRTLPKLSKRAMDSCQLRLDNLAKPIYCLGYLEQLAVELAGILDDERPPLGLNRALLCFTGIGALSATQRQLTSAFACHADAEVTIGHLRHDRPPAEAFDFGRMVAEDITLSAPLLAVALAESSASDICGTKTAAIKSALCRADGSLRYSAAEFLQYVPKPLKSDVSALIGAMIAAAHNNSLVILDNEATEIIARYAELLCPDIKPYILHTQPALLRLNMTTGGGCIACLGLRVVDAALHVLNDMKTFAESRVSAAKDGPGAGRQQE
jgi:nicotinate-nucleotide--dimethylbenzimidazole phosphoribosyltransferase